MRKQWFTLVAVLAVTLAMTGAAFGSDVGSLEGITELNFGIISTESTAGLQKGFDPFLEDMPRELRAKIKGFVLGYGRNGGDVDREKKVLAGISSGWAPFHNSDNRQLLPIREIALVKDIKKLESQGSLGDAEQKKLDTLKAKLEELQRYRMLIAQFNDDLI